MESNCLSSACASWSGGSLVSAIGTSVGCGVGAVVGGNVGPGVGVVLGCAVGQGVGRFDGAHVGPGVGTGVGNLFPNATEKDRILSISIARLSSSTLTASLASNFLRSAFAKSCGSDRFRWRCTCPRLSPAPARAHAQATHANSTDGRRGSARTITVRMCCTDTRGTQHSAPEVAQTPTRGKSQACFWCWVFWALLVEFPLYRIVLNW